MFDQLFGSKTRVKLLSLFLGNPGRSYYVREITRKIDEQINSVRRELANLLSIGIIRSDSANNRLYYEVSQKYEYYSELHSIFSQIPLKAKEVKELREEDEIAKKLKSAGTVELAFLTGVFVRDQHIGIDMFVVGDVNRAKMSKIVAELEHEMNREINFTVMTPEDFAYRQDLNDRFVSTIMDSRKIVLVDERDKPLRHSEIDLEAVQPEGAKQGVHLTVKVNKTDEGF